MDLPDDADGDAMRRVLNGGSDPSKPMDIDFLVACPSIESAEAISPLAEAKGYRPSIHLGGDDGSVTCCCMKSMLLDYESLISAQADLDALARAYGGFIDGWGTFGNVPEPTNT